MTKRRWEYWRDHSGLCPRFEGYDCDCDCEGDFIVSDPWTWDTVCDGVREEGNATLIAEAGNVHHETGLTPRQLAEQRAELLEALEGLMAIFKDSAGIFCEDAPMGTGGMHNGDPCSWCGRYGEE